MKNIVIIGAGDLGKEVVWLIEDINKISPTYVIMGFLDDDVEKDDGTFYGYKVLGHIDKLETLSKMTPLSAVIAIQDGSVRKRIVNDCGFFVNWESIIHPTAVVASTSSIGEGSIVFPHVTISADSRLGDFCLCYIHSTICNDCRINSYVSLMTGASVLEHVEIGEASFLSAGSCIYPHKRLGERVRVAVEATVNRDYKDATEVSEKGSGLLFFK